MDTFYVGHDRVHGSHVSIIGEEHRHLSRSLRKNIGDHILVTDGEDTMFEVVIRSMERGETVCEIVETHLRRNEPRMSVTLAVSLLKNPARFDFLMEKATELGVRSIVPLVCERTIVKHEKHERLEKIAIAAMKQSGRCYCPRIFPLSTFPEMASQAGEFGLRLIPHEKTEQSQFVGSVIQHHRSTRSIIIAVGPEGGFTEAELRVAAKYSFVPISLGPRRLRSETAAISALSWVIGGL